jgi:hypothetical protein
MGRVANATLRSRGPRHVGIRPSKRSQGMAVQVSVSAWPNERMMMTTFAATVSSGASKMSR